jgi:4-carboxymuconolactone decarboxylase
MFNPILSTTTPSLPEAAITEPIFPRGEKVTSENFSGNVWINRLTSVNQANTITSVGNVTFAPKSRTKWHVHPLGQLLLVTDGIGYYQEKGRPGRIIRKGNVINCPANIAHWHGASPNSSMTHVTIGFENGNGKVEWLDSVTDEEYNKMN